MIYFRNIRLRLPPLQLFPLAHIGGRVHPQAAGRVPHIAVAPVGAADVFQFQLLHHLAQVHRPGQLVPLPAAELALGADGQIPGLDDVPAAQDHGRLHHIAQLPQVAGPGVALQGQQRHVAEALFLAVLFVQLNAHLLHQGEDVLPPLPQGRDVDADDVEPVEEVGAEEAPLDRLLQIPVGGHQKAEVQLNALVLGCIEYAQVIPFAGSGMGLSRFCDFASSFQQQLHLQHHLKCIFRFHRCRLILFLI